LLSCEEIDPFEERRDSMSPVHGRDARRSLGRLYACCCDVEGPPAAPSENLQSRCFSIKRFRHADDGDAALKGVEERASEAGQITEHHIAVNDHLMGRFVESIKEPKDTGKLPSENCPDS